MKPKASETEIVLSAAVALIGLVLYMVGSIKLAIHPGYILAHVAVWIGILAILGGGLILKQELNATKAKQRKKLEEKTEKAPGKSKEGEQEEEKEKHPKDGPKDGKK